jgi:hypothetical protein
VVTGRIASFAVCAGALALTSLSARAAFLNVPNFSFESPIVGSGTYTSGFVPDSSTISGWTIGGVFPATVGVFNSTDTQFGSVPEGSQFAFIDSRTTGNTSLLSLTSSSNTLPTIDPGIAYTLTVAVGRRSDYTIAGALEIDLLANGVAVASSTIDANTITADTFLDLSTTLSADQAAALAGQQLSIQFKATNTSSSPNTKNEVAIDNVRVTSSAVPEPASLGVLILGSASLLTKRRRTR